MRLNIAAKITEEKKHISVTKTKTFLYFKLLSVNEQFKMIKIAFILVINII
jgi:hypothetical protein